MIERCQRTIGVVSFRVEREGVELVLRLLVVVVVEYKIHQKKNFLFVGDNYHQLSTTREKWFRFHQETR